METHYKSMIIKYLVRINKFNFMVVFVTFTFCKKWERILNEFEVIYKNNKILLKSVKI